jgi:hypothetical protein
MSYKLRYISRRCLLTHHLCDYSARSCRLIGQCVIQLVESLVDMVSKLPTEVSHLNMIFLKHVIKNLHILTERPPSPAPLSRYIPREQRILRNALQGRLYPVCLQLPSHSGLAYSFYT